MAGMLSASALIFTTMPTGCASSNDEQPNSLKGGSEDSGNYNQGNPHPGQYRVRNPGNGGQ
jgi:hypothetical protein